MGAFEKQHVDKYSLKCEYYKKTFSSIDELIDGILESGMDPNYEITKNGKGIGEDASDYLTY
jgi:hypothetical protein